MCSALVAGALVFGLHQTMPMLCMLLIVRKPWLQGLHLDPWLWQGWQHYRNGTLSFSGPPVNGTTPLSTTCWWSPPGIPCSYFHTATHDAEGHARPLDRVVNRTRHHDPHDTGSSSLWRQFYTQEIGDLVHEMYRMDFIAFKYEREVFPEVVPEGVDVVPSLRSPVKPERAAPLSEAVVKELLEKAGWPAGLSKLAHLASAERQEHAAIGGGMRAPAQQVGIAKVRSSVRRLLRRSGKPRRVAR
jgi:hypothetical protein